MQRHIQDQLDSGYQSADGCVEDVLIYAAAQGSPSAPKNTRGMFANQNVPITFEEIEETSQEACKNFPRDFPGEWMLMASLVLNMHALIWLALIR